MYHQARVLVFFVKDESFEAKDGIEFNPAANLTTSEFTTTKLALYIVG
jgi:hypothetical protein